MQRASRYRSAADVLGGYLRSIGMTDEAAARRLELPVGTLKGYVAGYSAPGAESPQYQALKVRVPLKVFERYWTAVEGVRTHAALPSFTTIDHLIEANRLGEADEHLTMVMNADPDATDLVHYATLAIRLGRRCLIRSTHHRKKDNRDRGRGLFWCGEGLDVALDGGISDSDAIVLVSQCASAFQNLHMYEDARNVLLQGLAKWSSAAELWRRIGVAAWYDGDLLNALAYLACARAYRAPAARVAHPRGQVLAELGEYAAAVRELDVAIAEPLSQLSLGYAYSGKAFALFFEGDIDGAASAERDALKRAPHNAWHYYRKGIIESFWQPGSARRHLERALTLDSPPLNPLRRKQAKSLLRSLKRA